MQLHPHLPATARPSAGETAAVRPASVRRRMAWGVGALLLLLLLGLLPPLVSANRFRSRIAASMSASLGRPVHLDNVSLHLFPTPGFTLANFVVSEDPTFGAEPTIRANTVEATLRLASLWRRPIEFSTIRFIDPSVNLVRLPAGSWNLSSLVLHASRLDTAPTAQPRAGPSPRFPYIEATGGRVNFKLGQEKLPFSLTGTDFALWLPSPQQWQLRLKGQPARTDQYITDPGIFRLEGHLKRAPAAVAVPAQLAASWHDAPLGEASRILFGDDLGWRGSLNLDLALAGPLGAASLSSKVTLGSLRRADFFPTRPLDLQAVCHAQLAIGDDALHDLGCNLPDNAPEPLALSAARVSLSHPAGSEFSIAAHAIPLRWALLWIAMYSPRIPTDLLPRGQVDLDLHRSAPSAVLPPAVLRVSSRRGRFGRKAPDAGASPSPWSGTVRLTLPDAEPSPSGPGRAGGPAAANVLDWNVGNAGTGGLVALRLEPTKLHFGADNALTLSGLLARSGYTLAAVGTAAPAAVLLPARYLPQLADGLESVLPYPPTGAEPLHLDFTCTGSWTTPQTCAGPRTGAQPSRPLAAPSAARPPSKSGQNLPTLLAPRSLSPYDHPR